MKVFQELKENTDLSICLGFFDGVHEGHKVVLKNTVNLARQNNIKSAVVTFKEHPLCYLQPRTPQYIISLEDRLKSFENQGIDYAYVLDFNEYIADSLAEDYLKDYLIKKLHPKFITTGFNHYFGANKQGDSTLLRNYQKALNYTYYEIPPITFNNTLISSTKIRQLVLDGSIENMPNLLGEYFYVKGRVITGNRIGRTINYPTANIEYPTNIIKPAKGVYLANVKIDETNYPAIANFGKRPTINKPHTLSLEAHILDFNENIYDKDIKISFIKKLRDEIKFNSLDELKTQIKTDETVARHFFKLAP